jgi:succinylglutamic semialdehyde dehydrogenase
MAREQEVKQAVGAAHDGLEDWVACPLEDRIFHLKAFAQAVQGNKEELAETISLETGKPLWESLAEVDAMVAKVELTVNAYHDRRSPFFFELADAAGAVHYRPLGVLAVLGPFNMPGHIPNGHIVPALLSGNAVVFKPSKYAPAVAEKTVALWEASGIPPGIVNLIQGSREAGVHLVNHPDIDGLLFTGSYETGKALHKLLAGQPEKILAMEMGGNNPLVVFESSNLDAAVVLSLLSAFLTAGQRCTCARRLIVEQSEAGDTFIHRLAEAVKCVKVGRYTDRPEPFCGPVISEEVAARLMSAQENLWAAGAKPIVEMRPVGPGKALLQPGLIDVTEVHERPDVEWFGPLLQVVRVPDFEAALQEANRTSYGLAAGLLSDSRSLYEQFVTRVKAGHMVWNRQTTGASSRLPFGGLKASGNHRPSGYFAVDYCSDPVASLETDTLRLPRSLPPGLETTPGMKNPTLNSPEDGAPGAREDHKGRGP